MTPMMMMNMVMLVEMQLFLLQSCWDYDDDDDYISWIDQTFGKLNDSCDDDDDQGQQLGKSEVILHL